MGLWGHPLRLEPAPGVYGACGNAEAVASSIRFANRYAANTTRRLPFSERMTEVIVRSQQGLAQFIEVRDHRVTVDEPVEVGGLDLGPNPYELVLGALGACTAMTIELYARRKGWSLDSVVVALRHERMHARDCAECETSDVFLDRISKAITLSGDLSQEQRLRLGEIAERCPVQRTLQRQVIIDSQVEPNDRV